MFAYSRRRFLDHVGRGMLAAGIGSAVAADLGCSTAFAAEGSSELHFGPYDALVDLMQSTPPDQLQPILVSRLRDGTTDLRQLTAAAALANAETFGGQDYVGYHTAMALLPALSMAQRLPAQRRPLPVLKVLYRNSAQMQQHGGASVKTLAALHAAEHEAVPHIDLRIRNASRAADMQLGERLFASLERAPLDEAFAALMPAVQDDINVHRFVLAHRAYGLADLLGPEYAHTILRQCVRFCVDNEESRVEQNRSESPIRRLLPRLIDQYKLAGATIGKRDPGDAWVDQTSREIYSGPPERSAEIVAGAIADGIDIEVVGETISLASNLLSLRQGADRWRAHGDAAGVHASDATNAWRNVARHSTPMNAIAGLIVAAYHSAAHSPFNGEAYPTAEHRAAIRATTADQLLDEMAAAIEQNDQGRASAAVELYGEKGFAPERVFDRVIGYTVSEDGRLHGEKYFHTTHEEFYTIRPAFRWRQLVSLARVTASSYGYDREDRPGHRAAGYDEACKLLRLT